MSQLLFKNDARKVIIGASTLMYNAVSVTLGAKGRNVILKKGFEQPLITKDGVTVARNIISDDLMAEGIMEIMLRAAEETNNTAGDGTTTSIVLAYNLLAEGSLALDGATHVARRNLLQRIFTAKKKAKTINSIEFKNGIDKGLTAVLAELQSMRRMDFETIDVARISANGDEQAAKLIAEAFEMVGKDGMIGYHESDTTETYIVRDEGLKFDGGINSDYFITNTTKRIANYGKSFIVIIDDDLEKADDIIYHMNAADALKKPLIVIAHKFGGAATTAFIKAKMENQFQGALIVAPFYGEKRSAILNDLSKMTGAPVLSEKTGKMVRLGVKGHDVDQRTKSAGTSFGNINGVMSSKKETSLYYDINQDHIDALKEEYEDSKDEFTAQRIAMLTGGVAAIKVGGNSSTEVRERLDRVEDAVNATRASLKNGVVAGGGIALLVAREVINNLTFSNEDEQLGASVLYKVLASPARKILENAELPLKDYGKYPNWIDVRTGNMVDFFEAGIVDPVNVTSEALKNAVSMASTLLTADAYVLHQR